MKVTINDVAKHANVSKSTVSKVFNGYSDVGEATRKKVMKAAKDLGYTPSLAARIISLKEFNNIALILNELNLSRKATMPLEVLGGVYQFTEDCDYEFVFYGTTTEKQSQKSFQQFCEEHMLSGVVVQGLKTTDPYFEQIQKSNVPTVVIDMDMTEYNVGAISIDNTKASYEAVSYLCELGHKNIAILNGSQDAQVSIARESGYFEAMKQYQRELKSEYVMYADYEEDIAYDKSKAFLLEYPEVTAIFCASDVMAIGLIRAAKDLNIKVPEDVSVIGFDDIILCQYIEPKLTTVKQDMFSIGYQAGKLLGEMIKGEVENRRIIAPHELVVRDSVKPI